MSINERFHGGLVFFSSKNEQGLDAYCRIVSATLTDYEHMVERQSILDGGKARITSARIAVKLHLDLQKQRPRLVVTLLTAGPASVDREDAQLVLLVMLYRMIEAYPARGVEWLSPDVELPLARFVSAFGCVSPRRVRGRQEIIEANDPRYSPVNAQTVVQPDQGVRMLASPDADKDSALAEVFRGDQKSTINEDAAGPDCAEKAENDIRRLTAWGMTGMVTLVSGPVGLSLAAVNLIKGEDFRLNTHVLALTAFLGVTTSTGAMAQVVSYLPL